MCAPQDVKLNGMQDVHITPTALVVLTFSRQLVAVDSYAVPIPRLLAPLDTPDDITAMAVVEPKYTNGRGNC